MREALAIVDYGIGNLRSVEKAFAHVGCPAFLTSDPEAVASARGIVLPGVGAFARGMANLKDSGLERAVRDAVAAGKPFLGICVGLQVLFDESEERVGFAGPGERPPGLGLLPGRVRRFQGNLKVPQMGWNRLRILKEDPLFRNVPQGSYVYFLHSYYAEPADFSVVAAAADYGVTYAAAVQKDNVHAIQFHPEKSSRVGLQILRNFGEMALGGRRAAQCE